MKELRLAQADEIARLKEVWKLCFGDEDQYIDFFYQNRFNERNTAVLADDKIIAAMLTMLPMKLKQPGKETVNAAMIYGVATHPGYQKRGFSSKLLHYSSRILMEKGIPVSVLVPAEESLFEFYRKQGYQEAFYIREAVLAREEIEQLIEASPVSRSCSIYPISAKEYNIRRNRLCEALPHIIYTDEDIGFQKTLSCLSGLDVYGIDFQDCKGCVAAEKIASDRVMIKELLCPDDKLAYALKQILRQFEAREYWIRTAADFGQLLGGEIRPFGMIKSNDPAKDGFYVEKKGYLGLAFD